VDKEKNGQKRRTWEHPWRYREGFLIVLELALLGFIFQVFAGGRGAPLMKWPLNATLGIGIILLVVFIYRRFKSESIIKWLASVPAAISAISFFTVVVLLLGFIPQGGGSGNRFLDLLGLTNVKNSWLMMVSGLYFLVTLGFVTIRRSSPLNRKNLGFLLNHGGLWITIAAGYLGSGDLEKLNIRLLEDHAGVNLAMDQRTGEIDSLPFRIALTDFAIEDYNPKMGILDGTTGDLMGEDGRLLQVIEEGLKTSMLDWNIEVISYLPDAYSITPGEGYFARDSMGAAPAALVRAVHPERGLAREGWISCGSFMVMFSYLQLDPNHYLAMTTPEPKKYSSDLVITNHEGGEEKVRVEVNKPFKYMGWKLYQLSYDERMGKWSRISVLEAVRDPWLPLVYTGIFMLLAGAAYLFWTGSTIKE
jgi:hypothetical protein